MNGMVQNISFPDRIRRADIIEHFPEFDAEWYQNSFSDVGQSNLNPAQHFCGFGVKLARPISFNNETLVYASDALRTALNKQPVISFCIPVMNRPDDVRNTLAWNLEQNRGFSDEIEFVLVFMDEDADTHDWVRNTFHEELKSGYLRIIIAPALDGWHFGKAKNQHKAYATGEIFSSLDGDNFVTREEVQQLLDIEQEHGKHFVFHHFTGIWGDGSSGRISTSMTLYREIGYDELFMPRQFDEMDFIFTALARDPSLPLLRTETENNALSSVRSAEFVKLANLVNPVVQVPTVERRSPINPKTDSYVADDPSMALMQSFNQWMCFTKNSPSPQVKKTYQKRLLDARHKMTDGLSGEKLLSVLFSSHDIPAPDSLEIGSDDVCLFTCMKNDDLFLTQFYNKHKKLGVKHFFIIDDGSDTPIRTTLPYEDVHIFHPKVGTFSSSKGMWIDALVKAYLAPGQWALTLDADEILDLPDAYASLPELGRVLRDRNIDAMPALLLDLVPGADVDQQTLSEVSHENFYDIFNHYIFLNTPAEKPYVDYHMIRWGFGEYADLSWQLDTRYHAFGTFDSLRKIPLFQARSGRHVNQGFHTLHYTDGTPNPRDEIWDIPMAMTIRHYKLLKLFSKNARAQVLKNVVQSNDSQYHARTSQNIARIFGDGNEEASKTLMSLPKRPISDGFITNIDPRDFSNKSIKNINSMSQS